MNARSAANVLRAVENKEPLGEAPRGVGLVKPGELVAAFAKREIESARPDLESRSASPPTPLAQIHAPS